MRRKGQRGGERGAVLVETAILIPIIIMITFGLIEFSTVYQSSSSGAGAARSAARTLRIPEREPQLRHHAAAAATRRSGRSARTSPSSSGSTRRTISGTPAAPAPRDSPGARPIASSSRGTPLARLRHRQPDSAAGGRTRRQQRLDVVHWDSVGVYIKLNHKYITKLFGVKITLTDHAVFRLEPAPSGTCP